MKPKSVRASAICGFSYRVIATDLNQQATFFGGRAVELMDVIAGKIARKHKRGFWVTARIDHIDFLCPVYEDETILFFSSINRVWNTSCEIGVKILVQRPKTGILEHVASAYFTFVHLDGKSRPAQIPSVIPETPEEKRRFEEAQERRAKRLAERKKSPPL